MKYSKRWLLLLLCSGAMMAAAQQNTTVESKVTALLRKMTLEEKVGQMAQVTADVIAPYKEGLPWQINEDTLNDAVLKYQVGSFLNVVSGKLMGAAEWNSFISQLQHKAQQTRLKIPILYGLDDIHGANYVNGATLFPQQIGQAATFNPQLVQEAAVITAYEARAAGVPWTFSPVLDLGVNPQWPRIWEGYGEDPYLVGVLGAAATHGFQDPLGSKERLIVSLKHYMAYSDPKSGKDRSDAWIPEHYLREYHLPPFAAAIKAGARNMMVNSALINGVPTHINKHILTDILKQELGFTGFVVTDWQDIENVHRRDRIAKTNKEAIMLAINAGIDMAMIPNDYKAFCTDLVALVKEGKVPLSRIEDAVRRILRVKYELGLFETPVTYLKDYPRFGSAAFQQAAFNTAAESITLLKNDGNILPLPKNKRILVTGPNANSMRTLNGGWTYTWQGEKTDAFAQQYHTILEAVTQTFGQQQVTFEPGVVYKENGAYTEDSIANLEAAVAAARKADVVLLCIGENSYTETPGNLNDLNLSDNQLKLVAALASAGKPVVLVLNEGRPRIISRIAPLASAIVHIYLPGHSGGDALAAVLAGEVNPSGKLPITYPRYSNALTNYIHKPSDGGGNPQGGEFNPQYSFGFGLSYTRFAYSNLTINKTAFQAAETVQVQVAVTNTGSRAGKEVVQLFSSQEYASLTPDVKRLRRFEKISLQPGETKTVSFSIPIKELAFVNQANQKTVEAGRFTIETGGLFATFTVNNTWVF